LLADLTPGEAVDIEGKFNEYIVSTLTEEKSGGTLFFAHRSFQEFLVAERVRLVPPSAVTHATYSSFVTEDVIAFLRQFPDPSYLLEWYGTLRTCPGPLMSRYLAFMASNTNVVEAALEMHFPDGERVDIRADPWTVFLLAIAAEGHTAGAPDEEQLRRLLRTWIRLGSPSTAAAASLASLVIYKAQPNQAALVALVADLVERSFRRARPSLEADTLTFEKGTSDFASHWLGNFVHREWPRNGQLVDATLKFDLRLLERLCGEASGSNPAVTGEPHCFGSVLFAETELASVPAATVFSKIDRDVRNSFGGVVRSRRPRFDIVEIAFANSRARQQERPS
jgi:hypothetical protein